MEICIGILKSAKKLQKNKTSFNRLRITRSYYAMYHAARAVVFLVKKGDDHESHSTLPEHLPKDFPDRHAWHNELKNARFERNRADYDPYPKGERGFSGTAHATYHQADAFIKVARVYLRKKGCSL